MTAGLSVAFPIAMRLSVVFRCLPWGIVQIRAANADAAGKITTAETLRILDEAQSRPAIW